MPFVLDVSTGTTEGAFWDLIFYANLCEIIIMWGFSVNRDTNGAVSVETMHINLKKRITDRTFDFCLVCNEYCFLLLYHLSFWWYITITPDPKYVDPAFKPVFVDDWCDLLLKFSSNIFKWNFGNWFLPLRRLLQNKWYEVTIS